MKRVLLLALCALFALPSSADQAVVGKRIWSFDVNPDGKTCTAVGVFPANGKIAVPAKLGGFTVTRIDRDVFFENSTVTALSIPAGVKEIGYERFYNDFGQSARLKKITVASGNRTFSASGGVLFDKRKTKLLAVPPAKKGSYKVPASVRTIGEEAFDNSRLTSVVLPKKLKTIEEFALDTVSLRKITVPASVTAIGRGAFSWNTTVLVAKKNKKFLSAGGVLFDKKKTKLLHCPATKTGSYRVPASVTEIGSGAFYGCSRLTSVVLGNRVRTIGAQAFGECSGLTSVKIPGTVATIDYGAFESCTKLRSVTIANGVKRIGSFAFARCTSLKTLSIPASVRTIGYATANGSAVYENPFGNSGVKTVKVADGNTAFAVAGGCLVTKDKKTLIAVPPAKEGALSIPSSVTSIESDAFWGCGKLTSIAIPAGMDNVSASWFNSCTTWDATKKKYTSALKSFTVAAGNESYMAVDGVLFSKDKKTLVAYPCGKQGSYTVPSSVRTIGSSAFQDTQMTSVTIPDSVTEIGSYAFYACEKLSSVTVPTSVKSIGEEAFGYWDRKAGIRTLSLPNKGACDIARQELPASCKVVYRDKTPVYWIRLVANGGHMKNDDADHESFYDAKGNWLGYAVRSFAFRDKATALPASPFANYGQVFAGWATSPNGAVKYADKASVKNLAAADRTATLYAKWRPAKTTYSFHANGGSGSMPSVAVDYDTWSVDCPDCTFTRDDWTFDHWNTKSDDSGESYYPDENLDCEDGERDVAITLYAIWTQDDYDDDPAPVEDAPAGEAGNGVSFSASGDAPWAETEFAGCPCFESGAIGDGGTSTLLASVEGSGTFAFRWRTSCEESRDIVFFSVDGKDAASRSGLDDDWASVSFRIEGDGPHALSWTYAKDASGSAGDDRARLADVVWIAD